MEQHIENLRKIFRNNENMLKAIDEMSEQELIDILAAIANCRELDGGGLRNSGTQVPREADSGVCAG